MARRRRRFRGLEATIKNLKNATSGTLDPSVIPAGSVLKNYLDVKTGAKTVSYTRQPDSRPGSFVNRQIHAFGLLPADDPIILKVSNRAITGLSSVLTITALKLNLDDVSTAGSTLEGFAPALAVFFKDAAQNDTKEESKITGRKYNPREGNSYTLPFGLKATGTGAGDLTFSGVAAGIVAALGAGEKVSFQPEKFPV